MSMSFYVLWLRKVLPTHHELLEQYKISIPDDLPVKIELLDMVKPYPSREYVPLGYKLDSNTIYVLESNEIGILDFVAVPIDDPDIWGTGLVATTTFLEEFPDKFTEEQLHVEAARWNDCGGMKISVHAEEREVGRPTRLAELRQSRGGRWTGLRRHQ